MAIGTPIKLTLYGPEDEVLKELSRATVPWKLLKRAVGLSKGMDEANLTENDLDALAQLVVDFYGGKVTLQELEEGADAGELLAVLQAIVTKASTLNPTPQE